MRICWIVIVSFGLLQSCGTAMHGFSPHKKYAPETLQSDYNIFRSILEESHPGIYWYTPKDSMDLYFNKGRELLKDSMTESGFRQVLSYVISKINCGHTTVRPSRQYSKFRDTTRTKMFPLSVKIWNDTIVVISNLSRKDSALKRGDMILGINNLASRKLIDTFFQYISTDGYNRTHKSQILSNRSGFGSYYTNLFGLRDKYQVDYMNAAGEQKRISVSAYKPSADSLVRALARARPPRPEPGERRKIRLESTRSLRIDTANRIAFLDVHTFARGYRLRSFFRRSFKTMRKQKIEHVVIDLRSNGGGSVTNSNLLTRYIAKSGFKVADSLYAIKRKSSYGQMIDKNFFNRLFLIFLTHKGDDGNYHFRYFERHRFQPKKSNHFDGHVYVLTGGNSFSASTLFAQVVRPQENVLVVGEETGGGAYGNTAWLIPDVTLPKTKVMFRLPLFRLVIDKDIPRDGRGIQPEVLSTPTMEAIRRGIDFKMVKALELIREYKKLAATEKKDP